MRAQFIRDLIDSFNNLTTIFGGYAPPIILLVVALVICVPARWAWGAIFDGHGERALPVETGLKEGSTQHEGDRLANASTRSDQTPLPLGETRRLSRSAKGALLVASLGGAAVFDPLWFMEMLREKAFRQERPAFEPPAGNEPRYPGAPIGDCENRLRAFRSDGDIVGQLRLPGLCGFRIPDMGRHQDNVAYRHSFGVEFKNLKPKQDNLPPVGFDMFQNSGVVAQIRTRVFRDSANPQKWCLNAFSAQGKPGTDSQGLDADQSLSPDAQNECFTALAIPNTILIRVDLDGRRLRVWMQIWNDTFQGPGSKTAPAVEFSKVFIVESPNAMRVEAAVGGGYQDPPLDFVIPQKWWRVLIR